jgi:DASS family divalent anion:Na+ symporter
MHLLAIFVGTIVGIILKPLPMGAVAMVGIAASAMTKTLTITEALSGFGNRVIWLIVLAFFISRGFIKTGLGARIAYLFMALLGRKSLGLGYGLVATDLVLAPAIPSNTARAGGVVFPILRSVAEAYESRPEDGTARRMGAFLTVTAFQGTVITSAMFLTAMAANPLAAELASVQGIQITWIGWALAALVPGVLSLVLVPWLLFRLSPPEIKETPEARNLAMIAGRGDYLISTNADTLLDKFFFQVVRELVERTECDVALAKKTNGVVVVKREEFIAAGGFDERFEFYGPEDKDLVNRLKRRGLRVEYYDSELFTNIPTPNKKKAKGYRLPISKWDMKALMHPIFKANEKAGKLTVNESGWVGHDA